MEHLRHLFVTSGNLHHGYVIIGDSTRESLIQFLNEIVGIETSGNPDFWHGQFDVFSIDDARQLALSQHAKDIGSGRKIYIIETNSISEGAQNSLLKVFEEPTVGTHFFILMPQNTLLPTLLSRLQVIHVGHLNAEVESILKLNFLGRMKLVKEITEAISDDEKTKQDAISLVNRIESELYVDGVQKHARELQVCEDARVSLYDNGAPVKMILEHVMLAV